MPLVAIPLSDFVDGMATRQLPVDVDDDARWAHLEAKNRPRLAQPTLPPDIDPKRLSTGSIPPTKGPSLPEFIPLPEHDTRVSSEGGLQRIECHSMAETWPGALQLVARRIGHIPRSAHSVRAHKRTHPLPTHRPPHSFRRHLRAQTAQSA